MRNLLTLALCGLVIVGCSSRPGASQSPKKAPPDIADKAPEGRLTEEVPPNETDSSLPIMTVNSPPILLTPIQGDTPDASIATPASMENWQTFTSSTLGVAVSYPPDWSVAEATDGVTFTAPTGATIRLNDDAVPARDNETKIGNRYCTSRTNEHGQTAEVCVDNASFIYTARFTLQKADGSTYQVTLLTKTRSAGDVFEAMFNSLKPVN